MPVAARCEVVPRGRWVLLRYVKTVGDTTSQKTYVWEVVTPGSGVTEVTAGDMVVTRHDHPYRPGLVLHLRDAYALANMDGGIIAKWDDTFDVPVTLYSAIYGRMAAMENVPGVGHYGDAISVEIRTLDPVITDLAPGDVVVVPRRLAYPVTKRANEHWLFHAEDVVATCPGGLLVT